MRYVYPKLSELDFGFIRIGGLGLGNMLFPYARALLCARDRGYQVISPTWSSIPVGQILRREENKRFYNDLFKKDCDAVNGFPRLRLLLFGKKHGESERGQLKEGEVLVFTGMEGEFAPLLGRENSEYIYQHLCRILQEKNRPVLQFQPGNGIVIHVRLGDFTRSTEADLKQGKPNLSIPVEWYADILTQMREELGEVPAYVFSDGTEEELRPLLSLEKVQRVTFGTAIGDILAMSKAKLFLASGSTFSRWVRYLGRMNTIAYPGQLGQRLLEEDEPSFEVEAESLSEEIKEKLRRCSV